MKKLFIILGLVLICATAKAQYTKSILLTTDDGTTVTLNLSRSLAIRFDGENLIASNGGQTLTVSLDKVKMEYSTESNTNDIETPKQPIRYMKDGTIVFQGLRHGEPVRVYSIDGRLLMTLPYKKDGTSVSVTLSSLPKGVCVIQAGKYSMKYANQ